MLTTYWRECVTKRKTTRKHTKTPPARTSHTDQRLIRMWAPIQLHERIAKRAQESRRTIQSQALVDLEAYYEVER